MGPGKLKNLSVGNTPKAEVSNILSLEARHAKTRSQGTRKVLVNEESRH